MLTSKDILKNLKYLRFDWNDEIPEEIIQGIPPQVMQYKVRGNWFEKVLSDAEYCDRKNGLMVLRGKCLVYL